MGMKTVRMGRRCCADPINGSGLVRLTNDVLLVSG